MPPITAIFIKMPPLTVGHITKPVSTGRPSSPTKIKKLARLNSVYQKLLRQHNVTMHNGTARIIDPHHIAINGRQYSTEHILIATGSYPFRPPIVGADKALTSDDMFHLPHCPKSLIIIGGGYIAVEFASIMNGLGCQVRLLHRGPHLLTLFDKELGLTLEEALKKKGVIVTCSAAVESIRYDNGLAHVHFKNAQSCQAEHVMLATGRLPLTQHIGLEKTDVTTNAQGAIIVDSCYRSQEPSIFALGDCINHMNLTPVALAQAERLVSTLIGATPPPLDYTRIATAVFSSPPIACVGLSEEQAKKQHIAYKVTKAQLTPLHYSLNSQEVKDENPCLLKALYDAKTQNVLGLHMIGDDAAEIMQGLAVAFTMGMQIKDLNNCIGIHPTIAEEWTSMPVA